MRSNGEGDCELAACPQPGVCPAESPELATTILNVPMEMAWYAELHGAKFNKHQRYWFVSGEIPPELTNFLPQLPRPHTQFQEPFCPRCGSHMRKIRSRHGVEFWSCSAFPRTGCRGSMSLEKYFELLEQPVAPKVGDILQKSAAGGASTGKLDQQPYRALPPKELVNGIEEIVRLAQSILGNDAATWLQRPKRGLGNQAPVTLMRTREGRESVTNLLLDLKRFG